MCMASPDSRPFQANDVDDGWWMVDRMVADGGVLWMMDGCADCRTMGRTMSRTRGRTMSRTMGRTMNDGSDVRAQ